MSITRDRDLSHGDAERLQEAAGPALDDEVARLRAALVAIDNILVQPEVDRGDHYHAVRAIIAKALGTPDRSKDE